MTDNAQWEQMFDAQWDMTKEIDSVIDKAFPKIKYPPIWRTMAIQYVIEHLAERARFDIELPELPTSEPETESEQVTDG